MALSSESASTAFTKKFGKMTVYETHYINEPTSQQVRHSGGNMSNSYLPVSGNDQRNRNTFDKTNRGSSHHVSQRLSGEYLDSFADDSAFDDRNRPQRRSRYLRLRESLFPSGNSDTTHVHVSIDSNGLGFHRNVCGLTAVQRLNAPAQNFKHVIMNLINYQEDCDAALISAPQLARLLDNSTDPNGQTKALILVRQLAKKHASRYGLASSEELMRSLIRLLERHPDTQTLQTLLVALHYLSACQQGAEALVRFLTIPILVRLLSHEVAQVVNYSLSILHNVMQFVEASKPIVRQCEGVQRMCELLSHSEPRVLTVLVDSLHLLSYAHQETKLVMLSMRAPEELIHVMRTQNYDKLLFAAARLMRVLSVCPENKMILIKSGAVQALSPHLEASSPPRLILSSLWTLRNLSDQAFHLTNVDNLIVRLVHLLLDDNDNVATCACGCICNFTCQNDHNKSVLVKNGGVEIICRALEKNYHRDEVTEPLCCALRHISHRHPLCPLALQQCQQYQGVHCVARLLLRMHSLVSENGGVGERFSITGPQPFSWPLLKAVLGLVRNLAMNDNNRIILRDLGVVPVVCDSLLRAYTGAQAIARQRGSIVSLQSELSFVEGVRLEDMCELALTALQAFSADVHSRQIIVSTTELLSITVQILYHSSEFLQRAATCLLCELAIDGSSAKMIEQEGATSRLTQLLHSNEPSVASFSATCLYRLAYDKSPEYRARLAEELNQSLLDAGVVRPEDIQVTSPTHNGGTVRDMDYPITYGESSTSSRAPLNPKEVGHVNEGFHASFDDVDVFGNSVRNPRQRQRQPIANLAV